MSSIDLEARDYCGDIFSIAQSWILTLGSLCRDSIKLMDAQGQVVHSMEWESFSEATALQRTGSGSYIRVPEDKSVLDLLRDLGNYSFLLEALEVCE